MSDSFNHETKVNELNIALNNLRDASAEWWSYSVSLRSFELLVGDPRGESNIVIALLACEEISGSTSWRHQSIQVSTSRLSDYEVQFELRDNASGFFARSKMLSWQRDFDLVTNKGVIFNK